MMLGPEIHEAGRAIVGILESMGAPYALNVAGTTAGHPIAATPSSGIRHNR